MGEGGLAKSLNSGVTSLQLYLGKNTKLFNNICQVAPLEKIGWSWSRDDVTPTEA